jgi:membrane protein GlpM
MEMVWKGIIRRSDHRRDRLASKRGNTPPGILPLFPTFALIALLIVGAKGDNTGFRAACIAGAKTIPAYLAFLAVCLFRRRSHRLPAGAARRACGMAGGRVGDLSRPAPDLTTIPIAGFSRQFAVAWLRATR